MTFQPTIPQAQGVTLIPVQDTPSTATPAATSSTATLPANVNVELNVVAVERTYARITVDGKVQFDGEAVPGTAYPYEAKNQVEILVGSASALSITYNGRDLGLMGNFGQVVDNIYTAQGVITPTATPLPTGTANSSFLAYADPHAIFNADYWRIMNSKTFHLVSLGCAKNTVDFDSDGSIIVARWLSCCQ